jgi:hypothetical protein
MIETLTVCVSFGLGMFNATPLDRGERVCVLADCYRFGVNAETAERFARLAKDHAEGMRDEVEAWNTPEVFAAWQLETRFRFEVWNTLAGALGGRYRFEVCGFAAPQWDRSRVARLNHLEELRELIGDEAYGAGRLPNPAPRYRKYDH